MQLATTTPTTLAGQLMTGRLRGVIVGNPGLMQCTHAFEPYCCVARIFCAEYVATSHMVSLDCFLVQM